MKWMLAGVLAILCSMLGETVWAQQSRACSGELVGDGQPVYYEGVETQTISGGFLPTTPVVAGGSVTGQPLGSGGTVNQPGAQGGQVAPYSYWVGHQGPARTYAPYGAVDQFPFQGRPYGSPSDRWSWYYMGGGNSRYLTRYYYPPLP